MEVHVVRQVLSSAAAGSVLFMSGGPLWAGQLCPEQPSRPHFSAADAPNWGYHPTCWQRFPAVPPCNNGCPDSSSGLILPFSAEPYPSGSMMTPSSGMIVPVPDPSGSSPISIPPGIETAGGMPGSPLPAVPGAGRYAIPGPMQSYDPSGPQRNSAPPLVPPAQGNLPTPERTFQAAPLPPLPGLPSQSSVVPQRTVFQGTSGLILVPATASSGHSDPGNLNTRYPRSIRPVSDAVAGGSAAMALPGGIRPAAPLSQSVLRNGSAGARGILHGRYGQ